ncbi:hypothetical protein HNR23_005192 [Nocardiopsis mwathae]|uniref:Condensation domain-containing protein n=1 Tax=Nocardiopsis mwathae TaxID=1472723 RepID=A0A7W9YN65_9ACTN|nr:condensation domain-containing protein [Nocardiopsis mwathae]MBB6175132.1 hypothetical protein [Nocardiopsis mwathae]
MTAAPTEPPEIEPAAVDAGSAFRVWNDDEMWFAPPHGQARPTLSTHCWWELPADAVPDLLFEAVRLVASRHDMLTSRIERRGDRIHCRPGAAEPEIRHLRTGIAVGNAGEAETLGELDPFTGPMLRAVLDRRSAPARFCLQISHAVLDGWSMDLLLRELAETYERLAVGAPVDARPAPQMRDWAAAQWDILKATRDERLDGWRRLLEAGPLAPAPVPGTPGDRSGTVRWRAPEGLPTAVRSTARRLRCSPTVLLVTLLGRALVAEHGAAAAVRVPFANRHHPGALDVIGNLSTQVPVLFSAGDAHADRDLGDLTVAANRRMLDAIALLPLSFEAALAELWSSAQAARADRQTPFFALEVEDGADDDEDDLAGGVLTDVVSPMDEQDGCEVTAEFDEDEAVITAGWRGLTRSEEERMHAVFGEFTARLGELATPAA